MATTILAGAQVSPSGDAGPVGGGTLPIGAIIDFGGANEPPGWVLCYGQALARVGLYADLFSAIGTAWGAGDGASTFNVPDLRGLVCAGRDNMGGTDAGRLGGILNGSILGETGGEETHVLTVAELAAHTHQYTSTAFVAGSYGASGTYWYPNQPAATSGGAGSGFGHNNIQPTGVTNKIIKYASVNLGPLTPGTGDVVGPAGAIDGDIAVFSGNTGKVIKGGSINPRSFNAIGNPNFEIAQRYVSTLVSNVGQSYQLVDRWFVNTTGSHRYSSQQMTENVSVPGSNYLISTKYLQLKLTTAQASLAAGDFFGLYQWVEGNRFRQLQNDVHSLSLLIRSSVANLKFAITLRDNNGSSVTRSLAKLCTLGNANTWNLIQLPNLPVFPAAGQFSNAYSSYGYQLCISLAAGSSSIGSPDVWYSANMLGATGMDNFSSNALNSTFDLAFVQHEPGSQCTGLIDIPWFTNLRECQRYFCKSYDYQTVPGTQTQAGEIAFVALSGALNYPSGWVSWPVPLWTIPTVTVYNPLTANQASACYTFPDSTARAVSGVQSPNSMGFTGLSIPGGSQPATNQYAYVHYIAATPL